MRAHVSFRHGDLFIKYTIAAAVAIRAIKLADTAYTQNGCMRTAESIGTSIDFGVTTRAQLQRHLASVTRVTPYPLYIITIIQPATRHPLDETMTNGTRSDIRRRNVEET